MYREQEKQRQQARSQARAMKPSNYFAALAQQAQEAQNDSNRAYGFRIRSAKAGR
jgi:hypothetical protein